MGVRIKEGDAVLLAERSEEGDLSQALSISVDDNSDGLVFMESVRNEEDLMTRDPVTGRIELDEEIDGARMREALASLEAVIGPLLVSTKDGGLGAASSATADRFAVGKADWLLDVESLAWCSPLHAQLKAMLDAVTVYNSETRKADFLKNMSGADKLALAARARDMANELADEALSTLQSDLAVTEAKHRERIEETKSTLERYTTTTADVEGGIPKDDLARVLSEMEGRS